MWSTLLVHSWCFTLFLLDGLLRVLSLVGTCIIFSAWNAAREKRQTTSLNCLRVEFDQISQYFVFVCNKQKLFFLCDVFPRFLAILYCHPAPGPCWISGTFSDICLCWRCSWDLLSSLCFQSSSGLCTHETSPAQCMHVPPPVDHLLSGSPNLLFHH